MNIMRGLLRCIVVAATALPSMAQAETPRDPATYVLAVIPFQTAITTYKEWVPFAEQLSKQVGVSFQVRVYDSFPAFEKELFQGIPDFAFINPYHQLIAHKRHGYLPLVRSGNTLKGVVVVRKDSPIQKIADLNGKTVIFPPQSAFAASLYVRAELIGKANLRFNSRYTETHGDVYRSIILRSADAGGGIYFTLNNEPKALQEKLRVIYETAPVVTHPLSAHPRVPAAVRSAVREAIMRMWQHDDGRRYLTATRLDAPQTAEQARDYEPLEALRLERLID